MSTSPPDLPERNLSLWQGIILSCAMLPMIAFGALGAWGTYTNILGKFPESATALGVVAAGEGATFVLALVYVGLTLLGQSAPVAVRVGLWILPAIAAGVGAAIATTVTEAVVFAVTPMAMCVAAEGLGLLARRIVVYCTRVDVEAQRRNAERVQRLSYHWARAVHHPGKWVKKYSTRKAWRLAKNVGTGDTGLGAGLIEVQQVRLTEGANTALAAMFGTAVTPALPGTVTPGAAVTAGHPGAVPLPVTGHAALPNPARGVTPADMQVSGGAVGKPSRPAGGGVTAPGAAGVTGTVTDAEPVTAETVTGGTPERAVTLDQVAAVAGVPTPVPGESLSDTQLHVVLRHLRYRKNPPRSYRQAVAEFREAGYVGGEQRVRRAWGELMSKEEAEPAATATETRRTEDEEDEETERDLRP